MEYSSNGKGNLGVTLGAIGTGLSILNGGLGLLGNTGNVVAGMNNQIPNIEFVSKDEMQMAQELSAKDSEIALLKAEQNSEIKMTEVYRQAHDEIAALRDRTADSIKEIQNEINSNRREQDNWNANQNVANAQMASAITTNTNSISALSNTMNAVTQVKIPNSAVCPGWGNITVTPSAPLASFNPGTTLV